MTGIGNMRGLVSGTAISGVVLVAACALVAGCSSPAGAAVEGQVTAGALGGDEIRRLIVGNTVSGPIGRRMYDFSYRTDGTVYGSIGVGGGSGRWEIADDGVYCHEWAQFFDGARRCYRWIAAPQGRYRMIDIDAYRQSDLPVWRIKPGLE